MERIDAAGARDHIEMVERILAEVQPRLCSGGEYFVVWGIAAAYITVLVHLADRGLVPVVALWSTPLVLVGAILFSILRGRKTRSIPARTSLLQREFFNVLWLTIGMAFICNLAVYRIFNGIAASAIWSVAQAIVLLYIGMHGNRRAQVAGGARHRLARRREFRTGRHGSLRPCRRHARGLWRLRRERTARSRIRRRDAWTNCCSRKFGSASWPSS